jgi:hypothetical protein
VRPVAGARFGSQNRCRRSIVSVANEIPGTGYLAELAGDADGLAVTIDVGALESGQLTSPQAAEAGDKDERRTR